MLTNLTTKLQSTLSQLTDAHHGSAPPGSPPPGPSSRTHALDQLTNSLRSLQVQYSPHVPAALRPLQLVITSAKSLAIAFDTVAQSATTHARDIYLWGQDQEPDVKDVADRLAWLNYTSGVLASQLGHALGGDARGPLKQLRDAEQLLAPRRAARAAAQAQLERAKTEQERQGLQAALAQGEAEDLELEGRVLRARREGVREAERAKWRAVREYADKLLLLARGAEELVDLIPPAVTGAPTAANTALAGTAAYPVEYAGAQKTADVKSAVQHALDTYTPGQLQPLPLPGQGASLSRAASDRRSFGETHLPELAHAEAAPQSAIAPPTSGLTAPPPSAILPQPSRFVAPASTPQGPVGTAPTSPGAGAGAGKPTSPLATHPVLASSPPPLNPQALNQAPAPLPPPTTSPTLSPLAGRASISQAVAGVPSAGLGSTGAEEVVPATTGAVPTIAETGVPIAGAGPGPKSGSLRREGLHPAPANPGSPPSLPVRQSAGRFPTAEEEKRALERAERDRILLGGGAAASGTGSGAPPSAYHGPAGSSSSSSSSSAPPVPAKETESERLAKEEKRRLEREERERVLRGEYAPGGQGGKEGDDLPPYAA
ncbi:hypothetical protein CALCODRAFT_480216 [Calocera cornea HHB12733]|uniref:Uncharacterized protein n=1 Tax=Calocera cornea HHB12733 TaxID=1353952 RepID=A0A165IVZ5_9BASI|nr:hypothetical protein CALCODRAFT_480216 [Calocera cornea HHB12733]